MDGRVESFFWKVYSWCFMECFCIPVLPSLLQKCHLSFLFPVGRLASLCSFTGRDFVRLVFLAFCCFKYGFHRLWNVSQDFALPLVSKLRQLAFYLSVVAKALPGN